MGYGFKIGGSAFVQKTSKPSISGSFTYDGSTKYAVISNYDSDAVTISGSVSAIAAGIYTIVAKLKKGHIWSDGTKNDLSFTWSIDKLKVSLPRIANNSLAYVGSRVYLSYSVDTNKADVYGTTYADSVGSFSIGFSLKDTTNTAWSDGTSDAKTYGWNTYAGTFSFHVKAMLGNVQVTARFDNIVYGTTFAGERTASAQSRSGSDTDFQYASFRNIRGADNTVVAEYGYFDGTASSRTAYRYIANANKNTVILPQDYTATAL